MDEKQLREMSTEDIKAELQAIIDKLDDSDDAEATEEDSERMSQLTAELEKRNAENDTKETRMAAIDAAKRAINTGSAKEVDTMPVNVNHTIEDTTDYRAAQKTAFYKRLASQGGIKLVGGNDLTETEQRAAMLTTTAGAVVPVEVSNEIMSLIEGGTVLFADANRSNLKHQFEVAQHKAIKAGDAAKTTEGAAPTDEDNDFDTIKLVGAEIKKTVKMSRQMAVQSVEGFEQYINAEVASRLSVAADKFIIETPLAGATAQTATSLTKKALLAALGAVKSYGIAAPKGIVVYANGNVIWNEIAALEDSTKRSYFVDEKTEDPTVAGRIFGKTVKQDDNIADATIYIGFPDLIRGNVFDGPDVTGYIATDGTQQHCFDGYLLYDAALAADTAFVKLTIGA